MECQSDPVEEQTTQQEPTEATGQELQQSVHDDAAESQLCETESNMAKARQNETPVIVEDVEQTKDSDADVPPQQEQPLVPSADQRRPLVRSESLETLHGDPHGPNASDLEDHLKGKSRLKVPLKDRHQLESQDSEADRKVLRSNDLGEQLLWAAEKNAVELVKQLLEKDPSLVHTTDSDRYTPLHRACYANNAEVAMMLLNHGASLSARTVDDWEPLHCACNWGSVECALALIQCGADMNSVSVGGTTPVHLAAANPSGRQILELLLWNPYTNVNAINDAGDTPYDVARRHTPHSDLFDLVAEAVNIF
ncbi:ankyrin repeat domain-containing protein 49-like [Ornithodoros turicata]